MKAHAHHLTAAQKHYLREARAALQLALKAKDATSYSGQLLVALDNLARAMLALTKDPT